MTTDSDLDYLFAYADRLMALVRDFNFTKTDDVLDILADLAEDYRAHEIENRRSEHGNQCTAESRS
jgi:hypothetical protein